MYALTDWRPHALDGALLWFHRRSALNVRVDGPQTRHLRRRAPRLVLFGITNACNLACTFCSRDVDAPSRWTPDTAFDVLSGLAASGTLEVAFGGGEPLAFRGFDGLVERLATETPLAVHLTTNGVLLSPARLARLAPFLGEIRLSIYDDNAWEERVQLLAAARQTFGVNVLVTPERVRTLLPLLRRLAKLGCRDAALLRYVGPDAKLHLRAEDETTLASVLEESPLQARLSVCFGDTLLEVPRLFGGDCGAGADFVTLTSDQQLKACSFQKSGLPVSTAANVLEAWSARQDVLSAASPLQGCARQSGRAAALSDGVRVWRGFSGNNSGDCVLVGRFATSDEALRFVGELLPNAKPGEPYSEGWRQLLEAEGIQVGSGEISPEALASVGQTVMLHTAMAVEDDFPALRHLLWKRKGRAVYSGIHVHEPLSLVAGFAAEPSALDKIEAALAVDGVGLFVRNGKFLLGAIRLDDLSEQTRRLEALASKHDARLAVELMPHEEELSAKQLLTVRRPGAGPERLWVRADSSEAAARWARRLEGQFTVAERYVLVEAPHIGSRLGMLAQRHGATAEIVTGERVRVEAAYWRPDSPPPDVVPHLRPFLRQEDRLENRTAHRSSVVRVDTNEPLRVLTAVVEVGTQLGAGVWVDLAPADPLAEVFRRISDELEDAGPRQRRS